ncbi:MAG: nitrilase-related carbon-nitrogen hydrolase [Candidatus Hermodarchaeota archaeon]
MQDFLVAAYQMEVLSGEKEQNLKKVQTTVQKHHRTEIDLWVLPELFSTGFAYSRYPDLAENPKQSYTLNFLEKLSKEYNTSFVGSILSSSQEKEIYQNVGFILSPTKGVICFYPKIYLWDTEKDHFKSGFKLASPVNLEGKAKVGLSICYDLRFPEIGRNLALQGAEILITVAAWPEPRIDHFNLLAAARALENTCFHIAVNRLGQELELGLTYPGSSRIIDPWGNIIGGASSFEQVIQTQLRSKILEKSRKAIPVLSDRKTDFSS